MSWCRSWQPHFNGSDDVSDVKVGEPCLKGTLDVNLGIFCGLALFDTTKGVEHILYCNLRCIGRGWYPCCVPDCIFAGDLQRVRIYDGCCHLDRLHRNNSVVLCRSLQFANLTVEIVKLTRDVQLVPGDTFHIMVNLVDPGCVEQ